MHRHSDGILTSGPLVRSLMTSSVINEDLQTFLNDKASGSADQSWVFGREARRGADEHNLTSVEPELMDEVGCRHLQDFSLLV